jgi:uncharacterized protein
MSGRDLESPGRAGATPASTTALSLTDDQCWAYLHSQQLGRVAITVDDQPLVFPVNYAVGEKSVVFRTAPGTKLAYGPGFKACFEIDSYDSHSREGWSVMAIGMLEEITDAQDQQSNALRHLPVHPVAPGVRLHWIALRVSELTGRHFTAGWIVPGNWFG